MYKRTIGSLSLLLGMAVQPLMAADLSAFGDRDPAVQRLGLGVRIDFGAARKAPVGSLALITTGEFADRQVTLPLIALDFRQRAPRIGTLLGMRMSPLALRHAVSVEEQLRPR